MKIYLCVLLLITCCYCVEDSDFYGKYWLGYKHGDIPALDDSLRFPHLSDHSNHGDHIIKPCPTYDINCIRHALLLDIECYSLQEMKPDLYYFKNLPVTVPGANISGVLYDAQVKGLDSGKIKEFFINKKTDTLVLEVEFDELSVYSPKTKVVFYRKGKEPISERDFTNGVYKQLSLTLIVEHVHEPSLSKSYVFPNFASLVITAGPKLMAFEGFTSIATTDPAVIGKQVMATEAPVFMTAFLQSKFCDYGHRLY